VADSSTRTDVVPTATTPATPAATWRSSSASNAGQSMPPPAAVKGVTSAV
jgi:hypothetical protein